MKLKVCGVQNMTMVQACQDALVDYIGFNFVPTSKRRIDPEWAQTLSHAFTGRKVGVFQNAELSEVCQVLQVVDLDTIQLHGEETAEYIDQLRSLIPAQAGISYWKAFAIDDNFDSEVLQQYSKNCDLFLFDGKNPGSGTQIGDTPKLELAIKLATELKTPYALAGGITCSNIATILQKFPEVIFLDTASGVEEMGQFSNDKLQQMLTILRDE